METGNGVINWSGLHGKTANHSPYLSLLLSSLLQHIGKGGLGYPLLNKSMFYYLKARQCVIQCTMYVPIYVLWTVDS